MRLLKLILKKNKKKKNWKLSKFSKKWVLMPKNRKIEKKSKKSDFQKKNWLFGKFFCQAPQNRVFVLWKRFYACSTRLRLIKKIKRARKFSDIRTLLKRSMFFIGKLHFSTFFIWNPYQKNIFRNFHQQNPRRKFCFEKKRIIFLIVWIGLKRIEPA